MAVYIDSSRISSGTKANSIRCSSYKIRQSEPVDYEFIIKVTTMTLSSSCDCSKKIKVKFCTQGNLKDVIIPADDVQISEDDSKEVTVYSKATIQTIMSFNNGIPLEKIVKIVIEDHANNSARTICYSKVDLAEVINEGINSSSKSANIDVSLSQNLGLMRLCITPCKLELRAKVNLALTKPPIHNPCFKYDCTPLKTPKMLNSIAKSEINIKNLNTIEYNNPNEISFCPEGEFNENEINEGESHYKSSNKNRSSSQINKKKPLGVCNRNIHSGRNTETANDRGSRGGSESKNWVEDSLQKLTSTDSYSNIFENMIFSGSKTIENKKASLKTSERYKRIKKGVPFDMTSQTESESQYFEPPREYYCNIEEGERLAKLSCAASSELGLSTENSVTCSMLSFSQFNDKDFLKNENEKVEFINKLNEAKKNEKKYKKEIKLLKMEKKALELKTTDSDRYFQAETEKILIKAIEKITERVNRPTKTKLYRPICRFFIEPMLKIMNIHDDTIQQFVDLVRNGGKESGKNGLDEKPIKLTKRNIVDVDSLTQRIKTLEEENQRLNSEHLENSKLQEIELDKIISDKQKLEELKKSLDEKIASDKKEKDDLNSKITNYKTRIFFLETQNEELENKKKSHIDMATNKLKIKNKNLEKELKQLKKEKIDSDNKVEGLRNKLEEFIGEEQSVKNKEKLQKDRVDKLNSEISQLERRLIELKTEYADRMYNYEINNQ